MKKHIRDEQIKLMMFSDVMASEIQKQKRANKQGEGSLRRVSLVIGEVGADENA